MQYGKYKNYENNKILKFFLIAVVGSLILTISAKIKIPFYPVPMTMQTFVVLFSWYMFWLQNCNRNSRLIFNGRNFWTSVFSNSPEKGIGLVYFTGPTMGYLIGFLIAAFFIRIFKFQYKLT